MKIEVKYVKENKIIKGKILKLAVKKNDLISETLIDLHNVLNKGGVFKDSYYIEDNIDKAILAIESIADDLIFRQDELEN